MTKVQIEHKPAESRFEAVLDDAVVGYLSYETFGATVDLQHTVVEPDFREQGIGAALVEEALTVVRSNRTRVRATCPFVADYIAEHEEHQSLLEPSLVSEDVADLAVASDGVEVGGEAGAAGADQR